MELEGAVVVPLFVGSSAGSRDTRLLLKALVRMLLAAVSPEAARAKDAVRLYYVCVYNTCYAHAARRCVA